MSHLSVVVNVVVVFFLGGKGDNNKLIKIPCEHNTCIDKSYRISRMRPSKFVTSSWVSTPESMVDGCGGFGGLTKRKTTAMLVKSVNKECLQISSGHET